MNLSEKINDQVAGPAMQFTRVSNAVLKSWAKDAEHLEQRSTNDNDLSTVVLEYLAELDNPSPDFAMRRHYRERMRVLTGAPPSTVTPT